MFDWLRSLDRWLFGPPHTAESVLRSLVLRLELFEELCGGPRDREPVQETGSTEETPTPSPGSTSPPP